MSCEHFGRCGGCAYLDISYEDELLLKRRALEETLGEYSPFLRELHPAPSPSAYRNKMEFSFGDESKGGRLALGIRKKRSYYEVAEPSACVLIPDDFKRIAKAATDFFRERGEAFYHRKQGTGALRHLVIRRGEFTGEILVILSATSALQTPPEAFAERLLALPLDGKIVGILLAQNDGVADAVKNENIRLLHGRDFYRENLCNLKFDVSAFSFFQTNSRGAQILYEIIKNFAKKGDGGFALDMYCGTGTIAQIIAPNFTKVIGAELVEDAITAARKNASMNGITNCEFFVEDLGGKAFFLEKKFSPQTPLSKKQELDGGGLRVVVLDPPRDGIHPKAIEQIALLGAPCVIYVACKPKSLVRDLPAFTRAGYAIAKIEAVDMFPRTPHVEAIALLQRRDS